MWPETRWPPISSPIFKDLSRFKGSSEFKLFRLVNFRDSWITSKFMVSELNFLTVKQTPLTATLSPFLRPFVNFFVTLTDKLIP